MNETILNILQHRSIRKFHEKSIDEPYFESCLQRFNHGRTTTL